MLQTVITTLCGGFLKTLEIFAVTLLGALPLGLIIAFGSMSRFIPLKALIRTIVWIVRGTPLMLQLLIIYYGPGILFDNNIWGGGANGRLTAALAAFIINYACYFSEIYRGGIESISKGQIEAGQVLGMTRSQIFFKMLENKELIPCCTGMIQKEVAERIAAGPGSKTYGILSVLIQAWYHVEYLFTVSEHVFNPPPKVKSAVIRMTRNETIELGCNEKLFKQVVKTTFNQRRKTLRNSIKPILGKECPLTEDALFNKRPEQLSVQEFINLTNSVEKALKTMDR